MKNLTRITRIICMKQIFVYSMFVASFFLISCKFPELDRTEPEVSEMGSLSLSISNNQGVRTIVPGSGDLTTIATYEVTVSRSGYTDKTATFTTPTVSGDIAGLEPGAWTITVVGKTAGSNIIATGSSPVTVALPGPTAASVSMTYITADASNTGSIAITLLFPKTAGIATGAAGVEASLDGVAISPALIVEDNGDTVNDKVVYTASGIGSASPLLRISLKKGTAVLLSWAETIWVYKNITTTKTDTLLLSAFSAAPPAPVSLTTALQTNDRSVLLSWPNVNIAQTYTVERSTNAGADYTVLNAAIAAGTTTYNDNTTSPGTNCLYRISASNAFGTSVYSTAASTMIPAVINIAAIPGVTAPVVGASPVTAITETDQYTGTVAWSPSVASTFLGLQDYTATITLTAKSGYTLNGVASDFFTVTGTTGDTNLINSGEITATFPATAVGIINLGEIQGVTAPVACVTPIASINETDQYMGTVTWSDAPETFAGLTAYTATITLTAKSGFTLNGVAADFFTVANAISNTNPINSGVITAAFPATAIGVVNIAFIPGVVVPVRGVTPVTTAIDTAQYTGTVAWTPIANPFAASTVYTANIELTAKIGYTLTGVAANSFKVSRAMATNAENSGIVAAVFHETSALLDYDSANIGVLKYVPAGSFQRDSGSLNISTINSAFRMSMYEITRDQFLNIYSFNDNDGTIPIEMVTWYDAIEFCNKLSVAEGLTAVYSISGRTPATGYPITAATVTVSNWTANGYRLPTEMEWMWAAMGATSGSGYSAPTYLTGYGKLFAGSDSTAANGSGGTRVIGDYAWYNVNSGGTRRMVGTTGGTPAKANELGLYDMSGNIGEWCWDWWAGSGQNYSITGTHVDYRGAASGAYRVVRSSSWSSSASFCPVAFRNYTYPSYRGSDLGFRVVRP